MFIIYTTKNICSEIHSFSLTLLKSVVQYIQTFKANLNVTELKHNYLHFLK